MDKLDINIEYITEYKVNDVIKKSTTIDNEINTDNINEINQTIEKVTEELKFISVLIKNGNIEIQKKIPFSRLNKKVVVGENIGIEDKILKSFTINNKVYYLYADKSGNLYVTKNVNDYFKISQKIMHFVLGNKIVLFGILTNTLNRKNNAENVYLGDKLYTNITRFFEKGKLRHIGMIKIDTNDVIDCDYIHNKICIGDKNGNKIPVKMKYKFRDGMLYFCRKKVNDKVVILRSTFGGKTYIITQVPYEKEYSRINLLKNNIGRLLSKFIKKNNINLIFEKEGMRACESGYYVFEKIMEYYKNNESKTKTYFIIDKNSKNYNNVKEKYNKNIIEKYSLKHYIYIYASKYFISSELSNHVINPRVYIRSINKEVSKKPLVFLQHGIMFAKPVDNPAAKGFYKSNKSVNAYKNVICSDLEAEQFYKMGYTKDDLIKTGLPKFDISHMDKGANKVMFMATYRYWEEGLIIDDNKIKSSTYYKLYLRIIKEFENEGLLDRLIISCHPKFAEAIKNSLPQYEHIIESDINKGLENAKVFITDFSSASYDAHYRGAYIIYHWEEKQYLIDNYKAIPPINEENCDGVPVYSVSELVKEVKNAISKNYIMDELYQERYRKINEFSDGKNGDRVIQELAKLKII